MNGGPENRIDKIVSDLLRGRRLNLRASDADEKSAITTAARLTGIRHGPQRMTPAFRKRLERALERGSDAGVMTRRTALVAGLGLAAGAAGGALLGRGLGAQAAFSKSSGPIDPVNGKWIDVAALTDLAEGHGMRVAAGGVGAYLFRHGDSVSAVSSVCSHLPCELWWNGRAGELVCPCHPVTFTPEGRSTEDPYALPPLNPVNVRVTAAGRVEVLGTE